MVQKFEIRAVVWIIFFIAINNIERVSFFVRPLTFSSEEKKNILEEKTGKHIFGQKQFILEILKNQK